MNSHRVLVIDDSLTIRRLVQLSLPSEKWVVNYASSGKEGISQASQAAPEIILLDFVLPDMKGVEVWKALSKTPAANSRVIVMTAKDASITDHFPNSSSLAGYLNKPFTRESLVSKLEGVVSQSAGASKTSKTDTQKAEASSSALTPSGPPRQRVAEALYLHMKKRLALIPTWAKQLKTSNPSAFFAKRIITPDMVDGLIESLTPLFASNEPAKVSGTADLNEKTLYAAGTTIAGAFSEISPKSVFAFLRQSKQTGRMSIQFPGGATLVFLREGHVVLATSRNAEAYLAEAPQQWSGAAQAALASAKKAQHETGTPVFVTLAAKGIALPDDLATTLFKYSKRLLSRVQGATCAFHFTSSPPTPSYVEAYGKPIPWSQITLESQRSTLSSTSTSLSPDTVLQRSPEFSKKLGSIQLVQEERLLLQCVDGHRTIAEVASKLQQDKQRIMVIAGRLISIDLLKDCADTLKGKRKTVMVLEPDKEGIVAPLMRRLRARKVPIDVVDLPQDEQLKAISAKRPSMLLINARAAGDKAEKLASALKREDWGSDVRLVAIVDDLDSSSAKRLSNAGYTLFSKPISYLAIERLLRS